MPTAGATITRNEEQKIESLVKQGLFLNKADFIRTAIRDLLEGFSVEEASKRTSVSTHDLRSNKDTLSPPQAERVTEEKRK